METVTNERSGEECYLFVFDNKQEMKRYETGWISISLKPYDEELDCRKKFWSNSDLEHMVNIDPTIASLEQMKGLAYAGELFAATEYII